jgi:hypothetical protein
MRIASFLALACFLILAAGPVAAQGAGFLSAYEDLPLPPGLSEVPGSGLSFDTPAGRIVEAYARGGARSAEILSFYSETLPQLGWSQAGPASFRRDAELLTIAVKPEGRASIVHFTISPE